MITWRNVAFFSDFQCGFRSSRSTADLLTVVSDRIATTFNRYGADWAIALDISKAFDRVWHAGILHKLKCYGVSGQMFRLFLLFSVIDSFEWFWMGSIEKNIQLMLEFLKDPFVVLHFSCYCTKILYNSGPRFTWVHWKFLEKFFIFFNPFPTVIFILYSSQGWWLFSIFRGYLWRNTQRCIEKNVCSSKQKGCTLLSMIFLCYLLGPDSSESREHEMATKYSFKSN